MTAPDSISASWRHNALFADVPDHALAALAEVAEERHISGGELLVRQGEDADALYFVETGRLRVLIERDDGSVAMVAQIEAGEPVGELAFFGGGTRTASLQASRDTVVMALDRKAYQAVSASHPELTEALLKSVAQRLATVTAKTPNMAPRPPRVIAVLNAGSTIMPPDFLDRLRAAMLALPGCETAVTVITAEDAPADNPRAYQQWLHDREAQGGYLLVNACGAPDWSHMACRNADALVMVGSADADPTPGSNEGFAFGTIDPENRTLVMLRERAEMPISGTMAWIEPRNPHLHHHVALDRPRQFARLARFLTGRAVGLVLAGGGALGCAHLGVVRALQAGGVPIDYIGGTSAGAAMGAAIAHGLDVDATITQMEAMFIDAKAMKRLTVPVHSVLDPHIFDEELRSRYGVQDIVDQPIGFFAISTNLSTNDLHVHRRGPLWEAVRASGSLPAILPPFIDAAGNILVDGGVLDNIPMVTMSKVKSGPNIIVPLGHGNEIWRIAASYSALRGRGQLLRDLILRRKPKETFPSILEVMQRSMVVASRIASRSKVRDGDVMLIPPILENMQLLDWHMGRKQAEYAASHVAAELETNEELGALIARVGRV